MKKKMFMFVYNDLATDARVMRTINSLSKDYELIIYSIGATKEIKNVSQKQFKMPSGKIGYLYFICRVIFRILFGKEDYIYGHDYYSCLAIFIGLNFKGRKKYIYDAHELIIPDKKKQHDSKRLSFFYYFEKKIVNRVSLLITASKERSELMEQHYKLNEQPVHFDNISILPKCNKLKHIQQIIPGITVDDFVIVYAGAIIESRGLETLFEDLKNLESVKVICIGSGDYKQVLMDKYPLPNITFLSAIAYEELSCIISHCDIGFINYPMTDLNNIYCASNKVYEYPSAGIPFCYYFNPTIDKIAQKNGIGIEIKEHNLKEVVKIYKENKEQFIIHCAEFIKKNNLINLSRKIRETISEVGK